MAEAKNTRPLISTTQPINCYQRAIGIFDSGVGGLSVLSAIHRLLPNERLIYVADTKYTPYGIRSADFIESRVSSIANFLMKKKVKLIVVACNTATATAVNYLRENYPIPIIGLEPALKPALELSANGNVGVLATKATLESQKYKDLRNKFGKQTKITEKASTLFVELVESAPRIDQVQLKLIEKELQPFIKNRVDALVLGCTHFPFLAQVISQIMGPGVTLFESGRAVAKEVKRRLLHNPNLVENFSPLSQTMLPCATDEANLIQYFSSAPKRSIKTFELLLKKKVRINQL